MAASEYREKEMRDAFGEALVELGHLHKNMIVLDADLHTSSKASYFKDAFPNRFLQIGIAEQNLFGVAAGLALTGFIPFPSTFAVFASRRALDQIALTICFPKLNVKIPGSYVGLPTSRAGASHNCIEDIAIMRAMPNMRVADPGDNADLKAIMRAAVAVDGPVYFRITRYTVPPIFTDDHTFEWGKGEVLRRGTDVSLFGTGIMTSACLAAAKELEREGVQAEVVHLASIKPIDRALIVESLERTGCGVTAENASITGGFGSAVLEVAAETIPSPIFRVGVEDRFVDSGGTQELFEYHKMTPADIANKARSVMALNRKQLAL